MTLIKNTQINITWSFSAMWGHNVLKVELQWLLNFTLDSGSNLRHATAELHAGIITILSHWESGGFEEEINTLPVPQSNLYTSNVQHITYILHQLSYFESVLCYVLIVNILCFCCFRKVEFDFSDLKTFWRISTL